MQPLSRKRDLVEVESKRAKVNIERLINQDVVQESTPYYIWGDCSGKIKFPSSTLNRKGILSRDMNYFTTKSLILAQDER